MKKINLIEKIDLCQVSNERLLELYYYWRTRYDYLDEYYPEKILERIEKECLDRMGGNK